MKNDVEDLIRAYEEERRFLVNEKNLEEERLYRMSRKRNSAAKIALDDLLPDLASQTVKNLAVQVRTFTIPTVPTWHGLWRKVAPNVNLDLLRINLGLHLDTLGVNAPTIWYRHIFVAFDVHISDIQLKIAGAAEAITIIDNRIAALKRLLENGKSLNDEEVTRAVKSELEMGVRCSLESQTRQVDTRHDDDNSLLTSWLWHELLTPDSRVSPLVPETATSEPPVVFGGGDFGGGGATGSWSVDAGSTHDMTRHVELGSNSFS